MADADTTPQRRCPPPPASSSTAPAATSVRGPTSRLRPQPSSASPSQTPMCSTCRCCYGRVRALPARPERFPADARDSQPRCELRSIAGVFACEGRRRLHRRPRQPPSARGTPSSTTSPTMRSGPRKTPTRTQHGSYRSSSQPAGTYDNELLDRHFITGDGRGNENIALTAVHTMFHSEHNRLVGQINTIRSGQPCPQERLPGDGRLDVRGAHVPGGSVRQRDDVPARGVRGVRSDLAPNIPVFVELQAGPQPGCAGGVRPRGLSLRALDAARERRSGAG